VTGSQAITSVERVAELVRGEAERVSRLLEAQGMAAELFAAVQTGG